MCPSYRVVVLVNNEVSTSKTTEVLVVQPAVSCHGQMRHAIRKRRPRRLAEDAAEVARMILDFGIACLYGSGLGLRLLLLLGLRECRQRTAPIPSILRTIG